MILIFEYSQRPYLIRGICDCTGQMVPCYLKYILVYAGWNGCGVVAGDGTKIRIQSHRDYKQQDGIN